MVELEAEPWYHTINSYYLILNGIISYRNAKAGDVNLKEVKINVFTFTMHVIL